MQETTAGSTPQRVGNFAYVIAGLSYVPLLGALFGVIAIIWGLTSRKCGGKRVAAIGAGGIGFTLLVYGALFYFGFIQRGGVYDELRGKLAQTMLNSLVQSIEFYRVQHGSYPESLKALQASMPEESLTTVFDPTDVKLGGQPRYFFYERVGADHYYLRGVGKDGQPFTADDIVPQIRPTAAGKIGLLLERK
ncbi:MAG: hypothetical protein MUP80_12320 [Acidobacteriia bacterium]|jgi:hypothetical protein|nr:hypothetical protein [Terriglobia bacterium]